MSYTIVAQKNLYGQLTGNTQTANLSFGQTLINQYTNEYARAYPTILAERTDETQYTIPSVQEYAIPPRIQKINTVTVTVSGFRWYPREVKSMQEWNKINMVANISSDIPNYYFIYDQKLFLYPKPANGDYLITYRYQASPVYQYQPATSTSELTLTITACPTTATLTGSVSTSATSATLNSNWTFDSGTYRVTFSNGQTRPCTFTNGSAAISWTTVLTSTATTAITVRGNNGGDIVTASASQANTYLNNTALWAMSLSQNASTAQGDSMWYNIDSVFTNGNGFILKSTYAGQPITTSSTVTIGEVSPLQETYQLLPVYKATVEYYTSQSADSVKAAFYQQRANELFDILKADQGNQTVDPTIQDGDLPIINPNLTINSAS